MPLDSFEAERQELRGRVAELERENRLMNGSISQASIDILHLTDERRKLQTTVGQFRTLIQTYTAEGVRQREENTALKATIQRLERKIAGAVGCPKCKGGSSSRRHKQGIIHYEADACKPCPDDHYENVKCHACINGVTWPGEDK